MPKILLSGVKPTGRPHIGNYFGAMKQFVDLQNSGDYDCHLFVADYHALNLIQNREEMKQLTYDLVLDYLAIGLDPARSTIFKQSDVSAHTELAWIFDTIVTMPYLMRAHAFKDAEAKNKEINVGTFNYPVLMAADILLYNTDVVPVGQDQKQHIEYARDIAEKFNHIYCGSSVVGEATAGESSFGGEVDDVFKLPEPIILEHVATVPGTDGKKMSKSYNNTIPLFATDDEIKKSIMSIATDSKGVTEPKDPNSALFKIYQLFEEPITAKIMEEQYLKGGVGYKEFKDIIIKLVHEFVKPLREKREELAKNPDFVKEVLTAGAKKANEIAGAKLREVKEKIGVL